MGIYLMIYQLKTNFPGFETVEFHSGINIILAKRTNITTNGVGKTLLLACIDYVLGAEYSKSPLTKYPELDGITISLNMDVSGKRIDVSRILRKNESKYIQIKGEKIPLKTWRNLLLKDKFNYEGDLSLLSWRSMWNFFVKDQQIKSFEYGLKHFQSDTNQKTSVFQSYFLDIAFNDIEKNYLSETLRNSGRNLTEYIKNARNVFEISPELKSENIDEYSDFQEDINKNIHMEKSNMIFYQNNVNSLSVRLDNLKRSLNYVDDVVSNNDFKDLYKILNDELGEFVKKSFVKSQAFYDDLISENKKVIQQELRKTEKNLNEYNIKLNNSQKNLKGYLNLKNKKLNDLPEPSRAELVINDFLSMPNNQISKEVTNKLKNISNNNVKRIKSEIHDNEDKIENYRKFLDSYINKVYQENEEVDFDLNYDDSLRINFSYKDDSGTGKGSMKLLFYYYFLMIINHRDFHRGIDMMLIDTDFTDGIDSNNLMTFFREIDDQLKINSCQLIITLREDRGFVIDKDSDSNWITKILTDDDGGYLFKKNLQKLRTNDLGKNKVH